MKRTLKYGFNIILASLLSLGQSYAQESSVLKDGNWYKIGVTQKGIYKIDQEFLSDLGINTSQIDPRTIKIFGNGGKQLPQLSSVPRQTDLVENAVFISGEDDATFDAEDYLLFLGLNNDTYQLDIENQTVSYSNHVYSDTTFYFLTFGQDAGKRIESRSGSPDSGEVISSFFDFKSFELDEITILVGFDASGREWYQPIMGSNTKAYQVPFNFPNLDPSQPIQLQTHILTNSKDGNSTVQVGLNGTMVNEQVIGRILGGTYTSKARERIENSIIDGGILNSEDELNVEFDFVSGDGNVYLNNILISAHRTLVFADSALFFQSWESAEAKNLTYELTSSTQNLMIWDITKPESIMSIEGQSQQGAIQFSASGVVDTVQRYVAFKVDEVETPVSFIEIPNQDLHGAGVHNLIIVSHPDFINEASRLADLRRTHDELSVLIVTPQQIYNEFSSGAQDVSAIRDYLKYLWDLDPSGDGLQYVLFFGKGSYDFKNRLPGNTNFVPIYESYNSIHPIFSYSSDDYFGFMEDNEGDWIESSNGDHTLELGVGRIPVRTAEEASIVVDKYYAYATNPKSYGNWKNDITFVADDDDGNLHQRQADRLADSIELYDRNFNNKKIYLDAFEQEVVSGSERSEEAYEALRESVDRGSFIVNFTGHGGELQWTQERILDLIMIHEWQNENTLPIFVTATCQFGRHDNPAVISGAEQALLRPDGGAIALVTTARPVFASDNFKLNVAFYQALLKNRSDNPRLGDVFRETKNNSLAGSVNRNFSLMGDPSMRIGIPEFNIRLDSINSLNTGERLDTLRALTPITISGSVIGSSDQIISEFTGNVDIILYEKPTDKITLNEDNPFEYSERDNALFQGSASVQNGTFKADLIIPKNIVYQFGNGKFSFYASSSEQALEARGNDDNIVIGGSQSEEEVDTRPPTIEVYMGDSSFTNGGYTKPNTILVVRLFDESGINISKAGFGQDLQAVLDNDEVFLLQDYYASDKDDFTKGWVHFPLSDLQPGTHTILVRAWDSFNNGSEATISFIVSETNEIVISNLRNYPNPVLDNTTFRFEHNRAGEDLDVEVSIHGANGNIVSRSNYSIISSLSTVDNLTWNASNATGGKLLPGIYFYRVLVRSNLDGASGQLYQRIVIY